MGLPRLVPVVQQFPRLALSDVVKTTADELRANEIGSALPAGARVAIGAGSRGITNLTQIIRATASYFRDRGMRPFVIPAMGSHGGGTGPGQIDVLAHYGVTEAEVGCPIVSSVDVVALGETPEGIETFMDRNAYESDGVFLVNRVKWHTTFEAPIESGLMKMASVGLGKVRGATNYHRHAVRMGFGPVIQSAGRHVLASGKVLGGLALLEDAHHQTAKITAIPAARIEDEEQKLLALTKSWMARIPFDEVDILIVDEIGKQFSGTGMDSKVVNRHPYGTANPWPWAPKIFRVYVRDLSAMSYGNAVGIGMADMISERLYGKIDWKVTRVNALAASNLASIRTPLRAASDREAMDILANLVGRADAASVTCVWIQNTLELSRMIVSENLLGSKAVEPVGAPSDWDFDAQGNLTEGCEAIHRTCV